MSLPNSDHAYVPAEKLTGYLLSDTHATGRAKARFFLAHGYHGTAPEELEQGLLEIGRSRPVGEEIASPHGTGYIVEGTLKTPKGTRITFGRFGLSSPVILDRDS